VIARRGLRLVSRVLLSNWIRENSLLCSDWWTGGVTKEGYGSREEERGRAIQDRRKEVCSRLIGQQLRQERNSNCDGLG